MQTLTYFPQLIFEGNINLLKAHYEELAEYIYCIILDQSELNDENRIFITENNIALIIKNCFDHQIIKDIPNVGLLQSVKDLEKIAQLTNDGYDVIADVENSYDLAMQAADMDASVIMFKADRNNLEEVCELAKNWRDFTIFQNLITIDSNLETEEIEQILSTNPDFVKFEKLLNIVEIEKLLAELEEIYSLLPKYTIDIELTDKEIE
jgi:hypothetical protein